MRRFLVLFGLAAGGVLAWRIGESLSSDAISMGLGILLGIMAGIPAALLVMASARRSEYVERDRDGSGRSGYGYGRADGNPYGNPYGGFQPPVIVVTAQGALPQGAADPRMHSGGMELPAWPGMRPARQFTVVGEREESIEDW